MLIRVKQKIRGKIEVEVLLPSSNSGTNQYQQQYYYYFYHCCASLSPYLDLLFARYLLATPRPGKIKERAGGSRSINPEEDYIYKVEGCSHITKVVEYISVCTLAYVSILSMHVLLHASIYINCFISLHIFLSITYPSVYLAAH